MKETIHHVNNTYYGHLSCGASLKEYTATTLIKKVTCRTCKKRAASGIREKIKELSRQRRTHFTNLTHVDKELRDQETALNKIRMR